MGLFSFIKDAGKKIFGSKEEIQQANPSADGAAVNQAQVSAIKQYIDGMNLSVSNLDVQLNDEGQLTLAGDCTTQADYEKVALVAGNVKGVSSVVNNMTVASGAGAESQYHTVEKGDTLWAIATKYYNDGSKFQQIVTANQPMIKDADEIYPGQVLRVPALA